MAANSAAAVGRELLSDWSAEELEAVLYALEVEEAIPKVRASESAYEYVSTKTYTYKCRLNPDWFVQVYQSSDPLDSKDFDPIDYINQLFPTEQVRASATVKYNNGNVVLANFQLLI